VYSILQKLQCVYWNICFQVEFSNFIGLRCIWICSIIVANVCESVNRKCEEVVCVILYTGPLSCTRTKWVHKLDFPHMDWPMANFPLYQYPLEKHRSENARRDAESLQEVVAVVKVFCWNYVVASCSCFLVFQLNYFIVACFACCIAAVFNNVFSFIDRKLKYNYLSRWNYFDMSENIRDLQ